MIIGLYWVIKIDLLRKSRRRQIFQYFQSGSDSQSFCNINRSLKNSLIIVTISLEVTDHTILLKLTIVFINLKHSYKMLYDFCIDNKINHIIGKNVSDNSLSGYGIQNLYFRQVKWNLLQDIRINSSPHTTQCSGCYYSHLR